MVEFRELRPDIDVVVDGSARLVEFRSHDAELAIRFSYANTSWPRVQAEHLVDASYTPLISPALLASGRQLRRPTDLLNYTLLHDDNRHAWSAWFKAAGVANPATDRGPMFPDGALGIQAAILGHGVVLGDVVVNSQDLRSGRLVKPFDTMVRYGAYWLVAPDLAALSESARAFADWFRKEIKAEGGA